MVNRQLRIAGGYYRKNLGDDILMKALDNLFKDVPHSFTYIGDPGALESSADTDYIVVGGGSHWPHAFIKKLANQLPRIQYSLLGLSARHTCSWLQTRKILSRSNHVVVRDKASSWRLYRNPRIVVAPDLSWLCPLDPIKRELNDPPVIGLNLRFWPHLHVDGKTIVECVRATGARIMPLPFFAGDPDDYPIEVRRDREMLEQFGIDSPDCISPDEIRKCDIVVGMRFHSLALAAQAEIPFVGFDDHPKARAFCRETGAGAFSVPLSDPGRLAGVLSGIFDNYAEFRRHLESHRDKNTRKVREVYEPIRDDIVRRMSA